MSDNRNILIQYLKIIKKIRSLLFGKISRDFLIFLFFVFISFSFWILQTLNNIYETDVAIPVKVTNVPKNVVITSDIPRNINVTIKDKGTVLTNYFLGKQYSPIVFDYEEFKNKGENSVIRSSQFANAIQSQFNQSTKILAISPDTIDFIYTHAKAKKLPVRVRGSIIPDRKHYISEIRFSPDSILVYAPNSILDTLTAIYTEPVMYNYIYDSFKRKVKFTPIKGVKITEPFSWMTLLLDVYAEKSLEVPVQGYNFPPNKILRTFPSKVTLSFQVGLNHFKNVTADDFTVVVSYDSIENNKSDRCETLLKRYPKYVNHIRIIPEEVEFLIEEQSLRK